MDISLQSLRALIYGDPNLSPPISPHPSDYPTYRILVIPFELGVMLANLDPSSSQFHIEFISRPKQAELWHPHDWSTSIAHRVRTSGQDPISARNIATPKVLESRLRSAIIQHLQSCHFTLQHSRKAAELLMCSPTLEMYIQFIPLTPELTKQLIAYRDHGSGALQECNNCFKLSVKSTISTDEDGHTYGASKCAVCGHEQ